jgi:hypothetical protein
VDDELDERAGQLILFPRLGLVAGFQADDRFADVNRITGPHSQVAGQTVTLVEDADDRDPLGHRRCGGDFGWRWLGCDLRDGGRGNVQIIGGNRCLAGIALDSILDRGRGGCQPDHTQYPTDEPAIHAASGLHAS